MTTSATQKKFPSLVAELGEIQEKLAVETNGYRQASEALKVLKSASVGDPNPVGNVHVAMTVAFADAKSPVEIDMDFGSIQHEEQIRILKIVVNAHAMAMASLTTKAKFLSAGMDDMMQAAVQAKGTKDD